jgi:putative membrane protein insertion efficiency factor
LKAERQGPGVTAALFLLRAYKLLLSPLFAGSCRFVPSCADYARDAILRHGAATGVWLALGRLGRCHPFCKHGHDPVPERPLTPSRIFQRMVSRTPTAGSWSAAK